MVSPKEYKHKKLINVFHKESLILNKLFKLRETISSPKNLHTLFRKKLNIERVDGKYFIKITADDWYRLYINGVFVCSGPVQGYHFNYNYNLVDITGYLNSGENVLAIHTYYQGLINRAFVSGDKRMGLFFQVIKNDKIICKADRECKYTLFKALSSNNITGYNTQYNEVINMNKYPIGWTRVDYNDNKWNNACEKEMDYSLRDEPIKTLQTEKITPKIKENLEKNNVFFDFGSEYIGVLKIKATGKDFSKITVYYGEECDDSEIKTRYKMRCNCEYKDIILLKKGINEVEFCHKKAFRYVTLTLQDCALDSIELLASYYPFDDNFCTPKLEGDMKKVFELCKNTVKYGIAEAFMDCPTREQGQYLGDMFVIAQAHCLAGGDISLFKNALQSFADSSFICKGLMAVAPSSFMQEIADYSLIFASLVKKYYLFSKDISFTKKMLKTLDGIFDYFTKFEKNGLLSNVNKWNLVDWPRNYRDNYAGGIEPDKNPIHAVINAFYIIFKRDYNYIRNLFSLPKIDTAQNVKAFDSAFYDKTIGIYFDTERKMHSSVHTNALALCADISTEKSVVDFVSQKGLDYCGVYFAYFVLEALGKNNRRDRVKELIVSKKKHSWLNMIEEGATTTFEAWSKDDKWNTSLCHPWATSPIIFIMQEKLYN